MPNRLRPLCDRYPTRSERTRAGDGGASGAPACAAIDSPQGMTGRLHERERDLGAVLTTMPATLADQVPETIRPALDMRPDSVGLYEIVHRA
jgi:hypothetical protein